MKFFYEVLSLTFLTVSAVVGAGFISGREIIAFFGTDNYLPFLCLACVLLSVCLYFCYRAGGEEKSLSSLNLKLFSAPKAADLVVLAASFISAAGCLAGISSLFTEIFPNIGFPVFSLVALFFAAAVSEKGIKGVEKISFIFMPFLVFLVVFLIFAKGKTDYSVLFSGFIDLSAHTVKTLLYVSMNCFINLPAIIDGAKGKGRGALKVSAVSSAALLTGLAIMIAAAIKGARTENSDVPLFSATGESPLFFVALILALSTSLFSAYYPLSFFVGKNGGTIGKIALAAGVFAFSFLGVKGIIDGLYPLIGGAGAVYLIKCAKYLFGKQYKKRTSEHNRNIKV